MHVSTQGRQAKQYERTHHDALYDEPAIHTSPPLGEVNGGAYATLAEPTLFGSKTPSGPGEGGVSVENASFHAKRAREGLTLRGRDSADGGKSGKGRGEERRRGSKHGEDPNEVLTDGDQAKSETETSDRVSKGASGGSVGGGSTNENDTRRRVQEAEKQRKQRHDPSERRLRGLGRGATDVASASSLSAGGRVERAAPTNGTVLAPRRLPASTCQRSVRSTRRGASSGGGLAEEAAKSRRWSRRG